MPSESDFRKWLVPGLEAVNADVTRNVASVVSRPGLPDLTIVHKWWIGFIEVKGEKTALRKAQQLVMRGMNKRRPGSAYIIRAPGIIESEEGKILGHFTSCRELLEKLQTLTEYIPTNET